MTIAYFQQNLSVTDGRHKKTLVEHPPCPGPVLDKGQGGFLEHPPCLDQLEAPWCLDTLR